MSTVFKKLGTVIAAAFAVKAIKSFVTESVRLYGIQEQAEKKLESVIAATGSAAGLTAEEMKEYATQLQKVTTYGDEVTINAMAIAATFKSIKGDVFKDYIASAQDLASVMGTDLNGAVLQLGKALEDPITGMTALRRSGVSFSTEQIAQVKKLVAEQKKEEAQMIVLTEVQSQFGGAAQAMANTSAGSIKQLTKAWGDVKEAIGLAIIETTNLTSLMQMFAKVLPEIFTYGINPTQANSIANFKNNLAEVISAAPTAEKKLKTLQERYASLDKQIGSYIKSGAREGYAYNAPAEIDTGFGVLKGSDAEEFYEQQKIKAALVLKQIKNIEISEANAAAVARLDIENKTTDEIIAKRDELIANDSLNLQQQAQLSALKQELTNRSIEQANAESEAAVAATIAAEAAAALYKKSLEYKESELRASIEALKAQEEQYGETIVYMSELVRLNEQLLTYAQSGLERSKISEENSLLERQIELKTALTTVSGIDTTSRMAADGTTYNSTSSVITGIAVSGIDTSAQLIPEDYYDDELARAQDFTDSMNSILAGGMSDVLAGVGEAIGGLISGTASAEDAWAMILSPIANVCTQLGELAIASGIGIEAIKAAFESMNGVAAIAAGVALIALGAAISGAVSNLSSGTSASTSSYNTFTGGYSNNGSFDYTTSSSLVSKSTDVNVNVTGEISGSTILLASRRAASSSTR